MPTRLGNRRVAAIGVLVTVLLALFVAIPKLVRFPAVTLGVSERYSVEDCLTHFTLSINNTEPVPTRLTDIDLTVNSIRPEKVALSQIISNVSRLRSVAHKAGHNFKAIVDAHTRLELAYRMAKLLFGEMGAEIAMTFILAELKRLDEKYGPTSTDWLKITYFAENVTSLISRKHYRYIYCEDQPSTIALSAYGNFGMSCLYAPGDTEIAMESFLAGCVYKEYVPDLVDRYDWEHSQSRLHELSAKLQCKATPEPYGFGLFFILFMAPREVTAMTPTPKQA